MLESLLNFKEVNKRPWLMAVWAFVIANIAVLISSQIGTSFYNVDFGFLTILFIIIPSAYFITSIIKSEEKLEEEMIARFHEKSFWERHEKDLLIFLFYFIGLVAAYSIWSFALPQDAFPSQISKINQIRGLTGGITASATNQAADFGLIFSNNIQVMLFSFLFAFIFGAGAIFIIEWNASILGIYIGQISKSVWEIPIVGLAFLPHGIPEIAGYLFAGLAGGLISAAITRKNTGKVLEIIAFDSLKILIIGILLVALGAGIEVWL